MNRRDFVKAGAVLAGACTTGPWPTQKSASTLPPVIVSEERVIRTVAGLRPYRLSGFALRAESLD
ncbi:MAG TPA: twin-arginine translocation signal domain-containing protein, partial [Thermoanaerobaculia bacterium]